MFFLLYYGVVIVLVVYNLVYELIYICFFFFKQKTAYEMRISDWSSDVCSSDLSTAEADLLALVETLNADAGVHGILVQLPLPKHIDEQKEIGRASCRERVCQYV